MGMLLLALTALSAAPDICPGGLLDRVVAYVDDRAITLSEFRDTYSSMRGKRADVSVEEVIDSMINRLLLLKEARAIRIEAPTEDDILKELIEIKIRAPIIIRDEAIRAYYDSHRPEFGDRDFLSVRDEIEEYLFERETTRRLKDYLEQLRRGSDIGIQPQR